jgi:hypothetical protein
VYDHAFDADLRGAKLEMARRIVAMRLAKDRVSGRTSLTKRTLSAGVLIEEYEHHVQQQRSAVFRLNAVTHRLMILSTSMKRLLQDENFVTLLRAESIHDIPSNLAERIGYVERLVANPRVAKYLAKHHAALLNEFNKLIRERQRRCRTRLPIPSIKRSK